MNEKLRIAYVRGEDVKLEVESYNGVNPTEVLIDWRINKYGWGNRVVYKYVDEMGELRGDITYKDLLIRSSQVGNLLKELNVDLEDRVLIMLPDSPEAIYSILGSMRMGAWPVIIPVNITANYLEYYLNDSRAKVLIIHERFKPLLYEVKSKLRYLEHVIVVGKAEGDEIRFGDAFKKQENLEPVPYSLDDIAFWLYSSGTTGMPKGTMHTARTLYYNPIVRFSIYNFRDDDITFSASKLGFAYGFENTFIAPLWYGITAILFEGQPTDNEVMLKILSNYGVTVFFAPPLIYNRLINYIESKGLRVTLKLRLCASAGEALPPITHHRWKSIFNVDILDGIGTTETCLFTSNRPGKVKPGSGGIPLRGVEVKIVDENGNIVNVNTPGRIMVKSPTAAIAYWRRYNDTKEKFQGDWVYTGDLGYIDEDGFIWHLGRVDDMIKSAGQWVSPLEIESIILKHPAVQEVAVVQSFSEDGIGAPKAFIVLKPNYTPSKELAEEIKEFVKNEVKVNYKVPRWIEFVNELPKTSTGKIQRYILRNIERERYEKLVRGR